MTDEQQGTASARLRANVGFMIETAVATVKSKERELERAKERLAAAEAWEQQQAGQIEPEASSIAAIREHVAFAEVEEHIATDALKRWTAFQEEITP